jgi:phenylacetate-CoA ligase
VVSDLSPTAADSSGPAPTDDQWVVDLFGRAARRAPAYRRFLEDHGFDPRGVTSPDDLRGVPPVTKENYLRRANFDQLLLDGSRDDAWLVSTSSGSTGKSFYWARGPRNDERAISSLGPMFDAMGSASRSTLSVVAFAMGTRFGGTQHLLLMRDLRDRGHRITTITPGTDVEATVRILRELSPQFEQTILQGYPPLVAEILQRAAADGSDLSAINVRVLASGEAISERWRDHVAGLIGGDPVEDVRGFYGTTDMGVLGVETRATVALRRLATPDSKLWTALYGPHATTAPTLVEYDPRTCHVEVEESGTLLFTVDGSVPLVRYRIGDIGEVLSCSDLAARVEPALDRPVELPSRPCILLHSRIDLAAIFCGANIYPGNIHAAIEQPTLRPYLTGKFVLRVDQEPASMRPVLHLAVECTASPGEQPDLARRVRAAVVEALTDSNAEYRVLHGSLGSQAEPVVRLVEPGQPEFRIVAKQRWIDQEQG